METLGMCFFMYVFGAIFIHAFCVKFVLKIPLLDMHALAIRNFLCAAWLIIIIIGACTGMIKK